MSEKRARVGGRDRARPDEPICTLHVVGLPNDARKRELRNLCIFLCVSSIGVSTPPGTRTTLRLGPSLHRTGFEGCSIQQSNDQTYGFARFSDPRAAHMAIE